MSRATHHWAELTTADVRALAARDPVAVLPLGAVEQHGPHLPLDTDVTIGRGLLEQALSALTPDTRAVVLPPVTVGASTEHTHFAGTLSLSPETAIAVITEIGEAVHRSGIRRLVLFNSHGGNRAVADLAALRLRARHRLLVVKANYFRFPAPPGLPVEELRHGLHGGALETAMMLALDPDRVRLDHLVPHASTGQTLAARNHYLGPEDIAGFAWMAQDLNRDGTVGDASLATEALGRQLVAHYGGVLAEVLHEAQTFPLTILDGD